MFQFQTETGAGGIGIQGTVDRFEDILEKHSLDSHVIVKVLDVTSGRHRAAQMSVDRWSRMGRKGNVISVCQRGRLEKSADAGASSCIRLYDIYCACREHPPEIGRIISVL